MTPASSLTPVLRGLNTHLYTGQSSAIKLKGLKNHYLLTTVYSNIATQTNILQHYTYKQITHIRCTCVHIYTHEIMHIHIHSYKEKGLNLLSVSANL